MPNKEVQSKLNKKTKILNKLAYIGQQQDKLDIITKFLTF